MILDFKTLLLAHLQIGTLIWPRSTMDSIRASEAPDAGSIPAEATKQYNCFAFHAGSLPDCVLQAGIPAEATKKQHVLCLCNKSINHDFYYKGHCENLEEM